MSNVCLYFQMHQPYRLRRYTPFDTDCRYFDDALNARILHRVAEKCYGPACALFAELIERHGGAFRFGLSITGVLVEQLRAQRPDILEQLAALARSGCVEFLAETYDHSLAGLYSAGEFAAQVQMHGRLMDACFGQRPTTFRNTELIYSNAIASAVAGMGYRTMLVEGADRCLGGVSANELRRSAGAEGGVVLLCRNYVASDDIAFRFSDRSCPGWPLRADSFGPRLVREPGAVRCVFIDLETLGEHQWPETGIFEFFRYLPGSVLGAGGRFVTPAEASRGAGDPALVLDCPEPMSWADTERDVSAWLGNGMQQDAAQRAYGLESAIKQSADSGLLADWRRLTISDHYYYMSTKSFGDGAVHSYFNPYQSPYDAYLNYMNVLDSFEQRLAGLARRSLGLTAAGAGRSAAGGSLGAAGGSGRGSLASGAARA